MRAQRVSSANICERFVVRHRGYRRGEGTRRPLPLREYTVTLTSAPTSDNGYMRDRMRVRPDGWPRADDAPTGPIPRIAVPTELPRPQADASAQVPTSGHHPARVLVIIGLAQLMVVLDTTIVNIALPSAQKIGRAHV